MTLLKLPFRLVAGLLAGVVLAGCRHTEVVVPDYTTYYPVVGGTYRTYAVDDTTWTNGVPTLRQSQLRERVLNPSFPDAAGLPAYQVVRSRRATATAAWVDDSVLTVQVLPRLVLQTSSNVRTVELVYPAIKGRRWNQYAFTVNQQAATYLFTDTITNRTRRYAAAGTAYTTPAAGGQSAKTYDQTVTTADSLSAQVNDGVYRRSGRVQVFAQGTGPVLRRTHYLELFTTAGGGAQTPTGKPQNGTTHREVLIETGTF